MYEIIVNDEVVATAHNVVSASQIVSFYRQNGMKAYYRPLLRKVA